MKISFTVGNTYTSARLREERANSNGAQLVSRGLWDPERGVGAAQEALALAALADELGFDFVSVSEHHYSPDMVAPNPAILAAVLTQVVKRAGIAMLGPLVSINNPLRIAEELAMLDQLSHGRLIGLPLRGTPKEFDFYNVNPDETKGRTQEAMLLIKKALSEPEPFAWKGTYFDFPVVSIWPGPTQRPHVPLYGSANSPDSLAFAAEHGFGAACSFFGRRDVARRMSEYRERCASHGWSPTSEQTLYRAMCFIGEDAAQTQTFSNRFQAIAPKRDSDQTWLPESMRGAGEGFGFLQFYGDPEDVVEQITSFHDSTGVGIIDLHFHSGLFTFDETVTQMRLFADAVLPRIRTLGAPSPAPTSFRNES